MTADPIALWVIPVADLGGVARHVLDVTRVGVPGWRVIVLCPEGPLAVALRERGKPVLTGAFGTDAGLAASVATLRRTVRTLRPAVVHSHLSYADIVAAIVLSPTRVRGRGPWLDATPGSRPRLVSTEHGIAADDSIYHGSAAKSALMARAHQARALAFDALIAVCQSTKDVMTAKWHPQTPITVVLNGIDRPDAAPPREPGLRVVSLARLAPEKGIDRLLDAFALLVHDHPDAHLTIAGTGPLEGELKAQVGRLGLGSSVDFPGFVDAHALMADADVLAQLSVWENCSYTILDACAAGLGVVATPVGGNPEILPATCHVPAGDLGLVAQRIVEQGLDPAARPHLAEAWPTVSAMCAQTAAVYGAALA
jgi:glycogen synthase